MSTFTNNSLIIDSPERQGRVRQVLQGALTLVMWLLWFYLLLPVFKPALAMIGVDLLTLGVVVKTVELQPFALALLLVGTVMLIFWLWAHYNVFLHRFHAGAKALENSVDHRELADSFGICPQALSGWQRSGQLVIRHTEQGDICSVEVGELKVNS